MPGRRRFKARFRKAMKFPVKLLAVAGPALNALVPGAGSAVAQLAQGKLQRDVARKEARVAQRQMPELKVEDAEVEDAKAKAESPIFKVPLLGGLFKSIFG